MARSLDRVQHGPVAYCKLIIEWKELNRFSQRRLGELAPNVFPAQLTQWARILDDYQQLPAAQFTAMLSRYRFPAVPTVSLYEASKFLQANSGNGIPILKADEQLEPVERIWKPGEFFELWSGYRNIKGEWIG